MELDFLGVNGKMLIELLSAAIKGDRVQITFDNRIDWKAIYDAAARHQVMPLIYPLLSEIGAGAGVPEKLLEKWRTNALREGVKQEQDYIGIGKVLEQFSSAGLPVIVLKGLVLRCLYPQPCFRTMCDVDLLVKPVDMDSAGLILERTGYRKYFYNDKHVVYSHSALPDIELHRSLATDNHFRHIVEFETEVWNRAICIKIGNAGALALSAQDEMLYLLLHMASHIISNGFGLRQLCDVVLVLKERKDALSFEEIYKASMLMKIDLFVRVVLNACHYLFGMDVPDGIPLLALQDELMLKNVVEEIFSGGVYGNDGSRYFAANRMIYYSGGLNERTPKKKIVYIKNVLFPRIEKLDVRYSYAKKYVFLLPAAWLHRLVYSLLRKDISFKDKASIVSSIGNTDIYSNRHSLLKQLELID